MSGMGTTFDSEKGLSDGGRPRYQAPIAILRLLTFAATLAAFVTMITNNQTIFLPFFGGVRRKSKYNYSDALIWFVVGNGIAFVYALFAALIGGAVRSPAVTKHLVILDLLVANIIMAAASAATAVAYIGKHGISEAGWMEICTLFDKYCDHVGGALIASFLGWLFLTIAILLGMRR